MAPVARTIGRAIGCMFMGDLLELKKQRAGVI